METPLTAEVAFAWTDLEVFDFAGVAGLGDALRAVGRQFWEESVPAEFVPEPERGMGAGTVWAVNVEAVNSPTASASQTLIEEHMRRMNCIRMARFQSSFSAPRPQSRRDVRQDEITRSTCRDVMRSTQELP